MANPIAIHAAGLSKRYHIGEIGRARYQTLRDTVAYLPRRLLGRAGSSKPRSTIWALDDVSFDLEQGGVLAVIGRNGAGKSTLLKLLSRITEPTRGHADIYGRIGALLEVGTGFHPELTGRENVFLNGAILGMRRPEITGKLDEILAFAEIEQFADTPVKYYSSGMYMRLAFSVAAHMEPEILVVDEVLAVGDVAFQNKCMGKMGDVASRGRTVVFVSHNMGALSKLCTSGLVLDRGRTSYQGDITGAIDHYHRLIALHREAVSGREAHVIFEEEPQPEVDFSITRVELLDGERRPNPNISTWDRVVFRIHYYCRRPLQQGGVSFDIRTLDGIRVMLTSTRPHSNLPLSFDEGYNAVDLEFPRLELAAGEYTVSCALAVPSLEWLCLRPDLGIFTVLARDVYASGNPPARPALTAPELVWTRVSLEEGQAG